MTRNLSSSFFRIPLFVTILLLLGACTQMVEKEFQITGSNRGLKIVELSYEVGKNEEAIIDRVQAIQLAQERCQMWGFQGIEPHQNEETICISSEGWQCFRSKTTIQFICQ